MDRSLPQTFHKTSHRLTRLHRLPSDVIGHNIILEAVRGPYISAHSRADLLATDVVLNRLQS